MVMSYCLWNAIKCINLCNFTSSRSPMSMLCNIQLDVDGSAESVMLSSQVYQKKLREQLILLLTKTRRMDQITPGLFTLALLFVKKVVLLVYKALMVWCAVLQESHMKKKRKLKNTVLSILRSFELVECRTFRVCFVQNLSACAFYSLFIALFFHL